MNKKGDEDDDSRNLDNRLANNEINDTIHEEHEGNMEQCCGPTAQRMTKNAG